MKKSFKKQIETDIIERQEEIRDLDEGEDKANAEENLANKLKAYAELIKAKGEIWKAIGLGISGVAALAGVGVEVYKVVEKLRLSNKIVDKEVNLMEQYQRTNVDTKF